VAFCVNSSDYLVRQRRRIPPFNLLPLLRWMIHCFFNRMSTYAVDFTISSTRGSCRVCTQMDSILSICWTISLGRDTLLVLRQLNSSFRRHVFRRFSRISTLASPNVCTLYIQLLLPSCNHTLFIRNVYM
jgi:hypothetical protein